MPSFLPKTFNLADGGIVQGIDGAQAFNQLQITNKILMQTFISLTVTTGYIQQLAKMYGMTMGEILQSQHFMLMHVIMSYLLASGSCHVRGYGVASGGVASSSGRFYFALYLYSALLERKIRGDETI